MFAFLLACARPDPGSKPLPGDPADTADTAVDTACPDPGFADTDEDGFGDAARPVCGGVLDATDCDDADATRFPGAEERCDGVDEDCDGAVDDDAVDAVNGYADADGDGWGDAATGGVTCAGAGLVATAGDCDDSRAAVNPDAAELCGNGLDDDCDDDPEDCALPAITTADDALARWVGFEGAAYSGASVDFVGDADGDGFDDLAIGAFGAGWQKGAVYLVSGALGGEHPLTDAFTTYTNADPDYMGERLAPLGDFDGDGVGELVASATLADWNAATAGGAWILPVAVHGSVAASSAAVQRLDGAGAQDQAGSAVAAAGDVDGDGLADALVGAYTATTAAGDYSGAGYLVLGTSAPASGRELSDADAVFLGEAGYNNAGCAMAGGDFDGDGFSDVAMGAYRGRTTGALYVFHGPARGTISAADADAVVTGGGAAAGRTAERVTSLGDLDGDGLSDLAHGDESGNAYVLLGPVTSGLVTAAPIALTGSSIVYAVDGGDLNHDGASDLAVGVRNTDTVYVLAGPVAGGTWALDSAATWRFHNPGFGTNFGKALAVGGDVNGDGAADLLVGATHDAAEAGATYLFGGAPGL